jgi:hypothetical protein
MAELNDPNELTLDQKIDGLLEGLQGLMLMQMRIYDLLVVIAREANKGVADYVGDQHQEGKILGPEPWFDGSQWVQSAASEQNAASG